MGEGKKLWKSGEAKCKEREEKHGWTDINGTRMGHALEHTEKQ
jgi:hypothetical protein